MSATLSGVSERRSCRLLGVSRARLHRPTAARGRRRRTDPPWTERLRQLIEAHPTFGSRRLWVLLRVQAQVIVNRKAVYRVLKQQRWCVHQRSSTPRPRGASAEFATIDCPPPRVSYCSHSRGDLGKGWYCFRLYYGPEFLADRFITWCAERAIQLWHIQPGKPDQNALIERYNRTYRTEVLNAYVFESLDQVREISAEWLQSYNEERPHDALAGLPPATYRAQLEARSSPMTLSP